MILLGIIHRNKNIGGLYTESRNKKGNEENYFFRLSAYQDRLQELYKRTDFVVPDYRLNEMRALAEPYIRRKAIRHLEKGRVVIFAAGVGSPYFTTDTTAALRANEMNCQVLLKATSVDGIYSADPKIHKDATRFDEISYMDVLQKGLKVMDSTAITLCMDNKLPIIVFNLKERGSMFRVATGEKIGTMVHN